MLFRLPSFVPRPMHNSCRRFSLMRALRVVIGFSILLTAFNFMPDDYRWSAFWSNDYVFVRPSIIFALSSAVFTNNNTTKQSAALVGCSLLYELAEFCSWALAGEIFLELLPATFVIPCMALGLIIALGRFYFKDCLQRSMFWLLCMVASGTTSGLAAVSLICWYAAN